MNLGKNTDDGFMPAYPTLDDVMKRVGAGVPGMMLGNGVAYDDDRERQPSPNEDLLKCYAQVFSSPAGQKVLEDLLDATLRRALYSSNAKLTMDQLTMMRVHKDGQNSIICMILKRLVDAQRLHQEPKKKKGAKK